MIVLFHHPNENYKKTKLKFSLRISHKFHTKTKLFQQETATNELKKLLDFQNSEKKKTCKQSEQKS